MKRIARLGQILTKPLGPVRAYFVQLQVARYEAQTNHLDWKMYLAGEKVFVAPLETIVVEGQLRTWTSWTQDVPAYLPPSDLISLTDARSRRMMCWRADVEAICGQFTRLRRFDPPRFTTPAFPTGAKWASLSGRLGLQGFDLCVATPNPRSLRRRDRRS